MKWFLKHRNGGKPVELPITSATLSGIRREGRDRGRGQRNGLAWRGVEKICAVQEADSTLRGIRNSAILRVMSDGLLRISEVTELRADDLEDNTLRLRFSKTDQEGEGEYLYLANWVGCITCTGWRVPCRYSNCGSVERSRYAHTLRTRPVC